jgi:hypothetical protein
MAWKADDEVTTNYGSIKQAQSEAFADGADAMLIRIRDAINKMEVPKLVFDDLPAQLDPNADLLTIKMSDFTRTIANSAREGIASEKASIADRIEKMILAAQTNGSNDLLPGLQIALDAIIKGGFSDIEIGGDE